MGEQPVAEGHVVLVVVHDNVLAQGAAREPSVVM